MFGSKVGGTHPEKKNGEDNQDNLRKPVRRNKADRNTESKVETPGPKRYVKNGTGRGGC